MVRRKRLQIDKLSHLVIHVLFCASLMGCATTPPSNVSDLCTIFSEKPRWHKAARKSSKNWGTSVPVMMAVLHQESRFIDDAKPPYRWFLFIPLGRPSSAYGYSQALDATWDTYRKSTGNRGADRDDFADSVDFVGWYFSESYRRNRIPRNDAYRLYLTYHEGHGGYARASYKNKAWLQKVARKVSNQALRYQKQYQLCRR